MKVPRISQATVSRLPVYVDCLMKFAGEGVAIVSSKQLSQAAGVSAAQLRKDLSYLGDFGIPGTGYVVNNLLRQMARYIGLTRQWRVAIVGYGDLGSALSRYRGFLDRNFSIVAAFDVDPAKLGRRNGDVEVHSIANLETVIKEKEVELALITTPAHAAQQVADRLVAAGVRAILSFAPVPLVLPDDVVLREVDLATEIRILSFYETLRSSQTPSTPLSLSC